MTTRNLRRTLAAILCTALLAHSGLSMAQERYLSDNDADAGAMLADLVFVRPFGLVGSVLGAGIFVVTLPFTVPSRSTEAAANALVAEPLEYTFNRPLGDFSHCGATHHACGD